MGKNLLLLLLLFAGLASAQETYNSLVYQGNADFSKKNYEGASTKFSEAAKIKDKDFTSHYNLGNSFYKRKMYEEARAEYLKASQFATNLDDKMAAEYNIGNTFMKTDNPEKAAEHYKNALKQKPYNESAQRNYQIAKLKEDQQKQQKNKDSKSGGGQDQNKNQESQDQKGKNPSQQQGGNIQNQSGSKGNGNTKNKVADENKISKEEEKALLDRTGNKERATAQKILNKNANSLPQSNEKDW